MSNLLEKIFCYKTLICIKLCNMRCSRNFLRNPLILISLTILYYSLQFHVSCRDYYNDIHRTWPSLRMPEVIISQATATANEESEQSGNKTVMATIQTSLPTNEKSSTSLGSSRKTVVFPSPICVSLPMAPCIILQIFWRNSSSSVLGARIPTNRIPSWPRPREVKF